MGTKDPRVDAYLEKAADFAKPILHHLRALVHKGCPDVEETIKWGMPSFEYKGPFCGMAAFKRHCVFGFWKAALLAEPQAGEAAVEVETKDGKKMAAMSWGAPGRDPIPAKITSLEDLPKDAALLRVIKKATKLNDDGVKLSSVKLAKASLPTPKDLETALRRVKGAKATFDGFPPSHRREYIEWITEAKREETRSKRIATAVEWIAEGKSRNWKYAKK